MLRLRLNRAVFLVAVFLAHAQVVLTKLSGRAPLRSDLALRFGRYLCTNSRLAMARANLKGYTLTALQNSLEGHRILATLRERKSGRAYTIVDRFSANA